MVVEKRKPDLLWVQGFGGRSLGLCVGVQGLDVSGTQ